MMCELWIPGRQFVTRYDLLNTHVEGLEVLPRLTPNSVWSCHFLLFSRNLEFFLCFRAFAFYRLSLWAFCGWTALDA